MSNRSLIGGVNSTFSPNGSKDLNTVSSNFCFFLYLFLVVDFFFHLGGRIPALGNLHPTLILAALITLGLAFQKKKLIFAQYGETHKYIIILIVYILISLPLVEFPGSVIRLNLSTFFKAVIFFFFTAYIIDSERRLKIFIVIFTSCQIFRVLEPLYLHLTKGYWGDSTYIGGGEFANRLAGAPYDVINPNELGFVIVTVIPFIHYLLLGRGKIYTLLYVTLIPLLLYALILTMSRGAFLALLVIGWIIFRESRHKIILCLVAMTIAITGWGVMSPIQKDRYISLISSDTIGAATVDGRLNGMIREFKLGLERPIVGHGIGTTGEARQHSYGGWYKSHNMYAELLIEIGIIGAIIFLRYILSIYKTLLSIRGKLVESLPTANCFYGSLYKALFAVFWMYAVYSVNYMGLTIYYWYLLGGIVTIFSMITMRSLKGNEGKSLAL